MTDALLPAAPQPLEKKDDGYFRKVGGFGRAASGGLHTSCPRAPEGTAGVGQAGGGGSALAWGRRAELGVRRGSTATHPAPESRWLPGPGGWAWAGDPLLLFAARWDPPRAGPGRGGWRWREHPRRLGGLWPPECFQGPFLGPVRGQARAVGGGWPRASPPLLPQVAQAGMSAAANVIYVMVGDTQGEGGLRGNSAACAGDPPRTHRPPTQSPPKRRQPAERARPGARRWQGQGYRDASEPLESVTPSTLPPRRSTPA